MPSIRRSSDSEKTYSFSLRRTRTFDELRAFQPVKRVANHGAVIADKPCELVGGGETGSVAVYESQYVPLAEERYAHALQAALDCEFQVVFALGDRVRSRLPSAS
jgi:hypothetical protein